LIRRLPESDVEAHHDDEANDAAPRGQFSIATEKVSSLRFLMSELKERKHSLTPAPQKTLEQFTSFALSTIEQMPALV
jgi:hypothetical protein